VTVVRYCHMEHQYYHMEHQCSHFLLEKVILTPCITPFPAYNPLSAPLGICFSREKAHPSSTISNASCLLQAATPHRELTDSETGYGKVSFPYRMTLEWGLLGNEVTRSVGVASLCTLHKLVALWLKMAYLAGITATAGVPLFIRTKGNLPPVSTSLPA